MQLLPGINIQNSQYPSTDCTWGADQLKRPFAKKVVLMDNEQAPCACGKEQIMDHSWRCSPTRHGSRNGNLFGAKFAFLWVPAESLCRRVILDPWDTLNTAIFTEIIIWEGLLVCLFILNTSMETGALNNLNMSQSMVSVLHDGFHRAAENIRTVN